MLFFGYSPFPPYLQYHVADGNGALIRSEVIDVAWPSMIHDFAITKEYVVFILCPLVFSLEHLAQHGSAFAWEPERGTRIGVMPRSGGNADVRWFETDPCYVFHPMNAYSDANEIVVDVARFKRLTFMNPDFADTADADADGPRLHRWRIDLQRGGVKGSALDDRIGEFPRVDERRLGRKHRFGYLAAVGPEQARYNAPVFTAVHKHDLERGTTEVRPFGAGNGVGEPLIVPRRSDAAEDDGYVLVLAYDQGRNASEFFILDARNIAGEPIASVRIPHRVPYGFHGNWVPATA
jgi:carotenoid cleavage dioxygenase